MRFRLAPNLSTLDDLERPKRPSFRCKWVVGSCGLLSGGLLSVWPFVRIPSDSGWHVRESSRGYFEQRLRWIYV